MSPTDDELFLFDLQGFLHLRGALSADEVAQYRGWVDDIKDIDVRALNAAQPEWLKDQLNRPVSRAIDADPRFAHFLDHPVVAPYLVTFLGDDYRHIDNEVYFTYPDYAGGSWHRGVQAHPTGHLVDGRFLCPMVKVFYCLSDVGRGQGEFVVVPASHKANLKVDTKRIDLPGQHVFDDVTAGDVIIFNEALLHNGRPNPSQKTRQTIIINFGREDAGPWPGYAPLERTLEQVSPRQRAILTNQHTVWHEPTLA